jgi:hypothetical protein
LKSVPVIACSRCGVNVWPLMVFDNSERPLCPPCAEFEFIARVTALEQSLIAIDAERARLRERVARLRAGLSRES